MQAHKTIRLLTLLCVQLGVMTACTTHRIIPAESPGLANSARNQIGRLAVRGLDTTSVSLTTALIGKSTAARNSASTGWLNGAFNAAGQESGEGALLLAVFVLITTPVVAAGGALYGASIADREAEIAAGNRVLEQALHDGPRQLREALRQRFDHQIPVPFEFVDTGISNVELTNQGFDSLLEVSVDTLSSLPDASGIRVTFEALLRGTLTHLASGRKLFSRIYVRDLPFAPVSRWAMDDAAELKQKLRQAFGNMADELVAEVFLQPAMCAYGIQPVSTGRYRVGTISGTVPLFVVNAVDGRTFNPTGKVEYELDVWRAQHEPHLSTRSRTPGLALPDPLAGCSVYKWRVRVHYRSFSEPEKSQWSPEYRFKTPCRR